MNKTIAVGTHVVLLKEGLDAWLGQRAGDNEWLVEVRASARRPLARKELELLVEHARTFGLTVDLGSMPRKAVVLS